MNSFYTSVEQQERPELRRRPVIVAPMLTEATCAIAASYEARRYGIKTGTGVREAKALCPNLRVVEARPYLYLQYHAKILEALNQFFATVRPLSVDEMACRVSPFYGDRAAETALAKQVKSYLKETLGPMMRCSVGVGPNVFLAKVGSEMKKPDGLTVLDRDNLPDRLFALKLTDLPGIAGRMELRLSRHGITTVRQLWEASALELRRAWGSIVGERWWHMLRGSQEADYGVNAEAPRKMVGHSHVLPPEMRTLRQAREVLRRLAQKALKRLRSYDQAASAVHIHVKFRHARRMSAYSWTKRSAKHLHANDDFTWMKIVSGILEAVPAPRCGYAPLWVSIVFSGLIRSADRNLSLFDDPFQKTRLSETVDAMNERFGYHLDLASVLNVYREAPDRIPFGNPATLSILTEGQRPQKRPQETGSFRRAVGAGDFRRQGSYG
jgi:DNA polymerase-4